MVVFEMYGASVLSSEGVELVCRGQLAHCGGVVMFASEEGRVRGLEACECDVDGGVVGEEGCVRGTGTGLRDICRRRKGSLGSVRDDLRERAASENEAVVS